jgi:hypothetical protein
MIVLVFLKYMKVDKMDKLMDRQALQDKIDALGLGKFDTKLVIAMDAPHRCR